MRWFVGLRIATKLGVMLISVILVFSLLAGILLWQTLSQVMGRDLEDRGVAIATEIAAMGSEPIQTSNLLALDELIYMAKNSNSFVEYIFIVDRENHIMAHTFQNGMPRALMALHPSGMVQESGQADKMSFSSDHGRIHDILMPIEDGSPGYVRVGVNEQELNLLLVNNFLELFAITFLVGLLGALFVFKLTQIFTRPLESLMQRSELIAHGHFNQPPLEVVADDEFGRLMTAMNVMAEHLHMGEAERKRLLGHLLTVQEDERKRISMELHDESGQALTALMLSMRALANQTKDEETRQYILAVRDEAAHILQKLRNLAVELRPPALDELGVEAAVQNLLKAYEKYHAVAIFFSCRLDHEFDGVTSLAVYRIIQECMTNIFKHAQASRADILFEDMGDGKLRLVIRDDGIGLTKEKVREARQQNRLGIYGMQERIRILGGHMAIRSERPEWSTVYEITLRSTDKGGETFDESNDRR